MSTEVEDCELLREYVANQSEPAFRTLVERHVDMVYATALRQVGHAHLAEEAPQAVFIALARKARGLSSSTVLAGWLFRAAQFAAAKVQRSEIRRKHWEQKAAQMEPNPSDSAAAWEQMSPQLNEALNELKETDRDALILRFFESKSMAQVGNVLGTTEGAAKMRIARALEQLRVIFHARGIALPVTLLAAALSTSATSGRSCRTRGHRHHLGFVEIHLHPNHHKRPPIIYELEHQQTGHRGHHRPVLHHHYLNLVARSRAVETRASDQRRF